MRRPSSDLRFALSTFVDRWEREGVVSHEQAERMRTDLGISPQAPLPTRQPVPAQPVSGQRTSLLIEALAYLGGVIVLVAAVILTARYWPDMSDTAQLGLVGGVAVLLVLAGFATPKNLGAASVRFQSLALFTSSEGRTVVDRIGPSTLRGPSS